MKIYIDLVILQDIFIMSLILFFTSRLLNLKCKISRIIFISFLSSILSIIILYLNPQLYDNWLIKFVYTILLLKYGLRLKFDSEFIYKLVVFFTLLIIIAGVTIFAEGKLNVIFIILALILIYNFKLKKIKAKKLLLESNLCFVEFEYMDMKYEFKALIDTGHDVKTLYEEEVIFVRQNLFPVERRENRKQRIVRYKTVSGDEESIGTKIYNVNIRYGEKIICNNAVIVSTPNILNQFDAIIGVNLIEGGWTNGNIDFNKTESSKIIS